ncbi:hypothetical protein CYLTODRAFT_82307 [Cylindrobasidium torrendii FP15055 ss-10]|uniref:Uncharacterized protein n=1 Tax=Cylindrobasidium torrendii FP15055 ss-10 TaxID=1314674 RepID=A0A0D7B3X0_9AGAR|nr:hypothetical protein CYLTODRAFT_82307 [Cylindrobasidium torrendii FP15055 ss-10]
MDRLRNIPRPAHIPCPSPLLTDRVARVLYFEKLLRDHGPDPWVYTQLADTLQAESFSEGLRFYQEALALLAAREEDNLTELYEELDIMEAALEDDARASTMVFDNALVVQPWKSVRDHTFPEDIVSPPGMDTLRDTWKRHCLDGSELLQRYTSHWAISTQEIEGTFLLTSSSTQDLMRRGLTEGTVVAHPKSTMQDPASIQMILYDTLAVREFPHFSFNAIQS